MNRLSWTRERTYWPHAHCSRFIECGGLRWHVQQMGQGADLLLIHGTGASTHSWRDLLPLLATRYAVTAFDLPGHGLTSLPSRGGLSLPGMAKAIADLVCELALSPVCVVGHSAGAAIGIRACLDGAFKPQSLISLNGALLPFRGAAGVFFPPMAKLMFLNPLTPRVIAASAAKAGRIQRLIEGTGSVLDGTGIALYQRLFSDRQHVSATLGMMAHWDLRNLKRQLPSLSVPLKLLVGEHDRAVPPTDADEVLAQVPFASKVLLSGLGHLAHEEDAPAVAAEIV